MIPESQILAVECMEIAVEALKEVYDLAMLEPDYELIQEICAEAMQQILRKQALQV